jgi:hypothetical protein
LRESLNLEETSQNSQTDDWSAEHCSAGCEKNHFSAPSNAWRSGFAKVF